MKFVMLIFFLLFFAAINPAWSRLPGATLGDDWAMFDLYPDDQQMLVDGKSFAFPFHIYEGKQTHLFFLVDGKKIAKWTEGSDQWVPLTIRGKALVMMSGLDQRRSNFIPSFGEVSFGVFVGKSSAVTELEVNDLSLGPETEKEWQRLARFVIDKLMDTSDYGFFIKKVFASDPYVLGVGPKLFGLEKDEGQLKFGELGESSQGFSVRTAGSFSGRLVTEAGIAKERSPYFSAPLPLAMMKLLSPGEKVARFFFRGKMDFYRFSPTRDSLRFGLLSAWGAKMTALLPVPLFWAEMGNYQAVLGR